MQKNRIKTESKMEVLTKLKYLIKRKKTKFLYLEECTRKVCGLKARAGKFKTLILGSSHLEVGYIPNDKDEYNCAISSLDLYSCYRLYQYANHKGLKNIIISFSSFSPFHSLINSPNPFLATYLKILCGIDFQESTPDKIKLAMAKYKRLKRKIKRMCAKVAKKYDLNTYTGDFMFWPTKVYERDDDLMTKFAINDTHRFYAIKHEPVSYLAKLIREAKDNNQKVYIVMTPIIDKMYKELMINEEELFREVYALIKMYDNVKVLNYYNDNRFDETDFYDWQHLNHQGAEKLTKIIKGDMRE